MTLKELSALKRVHTFTDIRDQLKTHIYRRVEDAIEEGDRIRDKIADARSLEIRNSCVRMELLKGIGGLPDSDLPLESQISGKVECDGYVIEKIIFQSRPGAYVTSNLYLPDGLPKSSPQPAVLFVCGHLKSAKHEDEYQIVCQHLVRAGLIVFAIDPIGQGERLSYYDQSLGKTTVNWGTCEHAYAGAQCWPLGDGNARYFLHDAMRAIDYLESRPEVDPNRIGVTGNSGGGTQTSLLMVCDSRIAAAAPGTFITDRKENLHSGLVPDAEQIWPGTESIGFDHEDILIAMAPKPVLILAVKHDSFAIEGTRRTVKRASRIWEIFGKGENLELFVDDAMHHYTPAMAEISAGFFRNHLSSEVPPSFGAIEPLDHSKLICTQSGQIRGDFPDACFVFEENVERLGKIAEVRRKQEENVRRRSAMNWLREQVFAPRERCNTSLRRIGELQVEGFEVTANAWFSHPGLFNYGILLRHTRDAKRILPVTIAVWDGGTTCIEKHEEWLIEKLCSGRAVMVIDVSGAGNITPLASNPRPLHEYKGFVKKLGEDLFGLGDSLAALRTYDVTRAIDACEELPGIDSTRVDCYGYGLHSIYPLLASAVDDRIASISIKGGWESFEQIVRTRDYEYYDITSIVLPGVLEHFDLPDLKRWLKGVYNNE